ncbi:hypothetical protein TSUD_216820 [Trifolium subterraneum]|uniref:Retrotransposon gag domain-containing protein n=1 Tax=Trifolium subterraneum TaxID=3900 RepID=A0A2Z6MQA7_TRISU|nr:hypothetical protein TSUD_216820 [Trifolium subterraneum]
MLPYIGGPLVPFNESVTQPLGIIILPTTFRDGKTSTSRRTIQVKFLVIPCTSVYNCILGTPTLASLGGVPSTVHIKMKYHGARQCRKKIVRELIFDPKIEKTAKANRKAVRLARQAARLASGTKEILEEEVSSPNTSDNEIEIMAGVVQPPRRTLGDYGQATDGQNPNLGFQPVNPVSFDIKNTVLSALKENQFSGGESECPNIHLSRFYEEFGYTDPTGISESNKKLRLFPLSLTERRNDITNFEQGDSESLYDAWERFKLCLKKCPKHGLDNHAQMQHFTLGLRAQTRMLLDASSGGSLKNKYESEARELMEAMSQNEYRVQNDRGAKKKAGMLELDTQTTLLGQSQLMNTQMAAMLKHFTTTPILQMQANAVQDVKCAFFGKGHANGECFPAGSEQAMYLSNFKKSNTTNNPYSNTYNSGWRDHPNFGWGGNQNQSLQQASSQNPQPKQQSPLEDALAKFIKMKVNQDVANKNHEASIKSVETQIGQLSRQFAATQNKGFEGSTKDNLRNESCMAINLRSREVPSPEVMSKKKGELKEEGKNESEGEVEKEWEIVAGSDNERDALVENQREKKIVSNEKLVAKKQGKGVEEKEGKKEKEKSIHAKLPYPRKKKAKEEDPTQFKKFMKMLHSLQMNIPFAEALEQMSVYAKFMKELFTKKRKPLDDETVNMTERIPGAVAKPTKIHLSLADRSITYPHGILENVLVRCVEFVFPADFVIRDMEEDAEVPLLLGRPFLATGRTLIDVEKGELMFRLDDEQVCFQVFEATTFGGPVLKCFKVDVLEEVVNDAQEEE